jgi:hypothetical protein
MREPQKDGMAIDPTVPIASPDAPTVNPDAPTAGPDVLAANPDAPVASRDALCRSECCVRCSDDSDDYVRCHCGILVVCAAVAVIFGVSFAFLAFQRVCKECPSRKGLEGELSVGNNLYTCKWSFPNGTVAARKQYTRAPMRWYCQRAVLLGVSVPASALVALGLYGVGASVASFFLMGLSSCNEETVCISCVCCDFPPGQALLMAWLWPCLLPFALVGGLGYLIFRAARECLRCLPCRVECKVQCRRVSV